MKKTFSLLLALSIALSPIATKAATIDNATLDQKQESKIQENKIEIAIPYKTESVISNEENFVKSLAESTGVTYEEAKKVNDESITNEILRIGEFSTIYQTEKQYFYVNSDVSLVMAVEIKYIHNNLTDQNQISTAGEPYMGVSSGAGGTLYRWSGGGFNKEVTINNARISTTGVAYVEVGNSYSAGFDLAGLSLSGSTDFSRIYTTSVKTYVFSVAASDL